MVLLNQTISQGDTQLRGIEMNFEERFKLLESELKKISSEDLVRELNEHQPVGPALESFLSNVSTIPGVETSELCNEKSFVVHVTVLSKDGSDSFNADYADVTQAAAA